MADRRIAVSLEDDPGRRLSVSVEQAVLDGRHIAANLPAFLASFAARTVHRLLATNNVSENDDAVKAERRIVKVKSRNLEWY